MLLLYQLLVFLHSNFHIHTLCIHIHIPLCICSFSFFSPLPSLLHCYSSLHSTLLCTPLYSTSLYHSSHFRPLPSKMQTALDLPEIRSTIASHLHSTSPHSLLPCMLVSKTWHDSFHPFRWKTVHLHGVHSVKANVTLRRHATHVRELGFLGVESLKHFSDTELYSRVKRVRVLGAGEEGRVVWEKLAGLVGAGGGGGLRWLSVEDSVPLPVFLVALGGGDEKGKEDRLRLMEQQQRQQEYESEDSEESEGEDESGQGRQGGGSGVGTLPTTPTTSTTSVNTTIDSVTTTLTPLSFFSSSTTRSGGERRLDTLVWKRVRVSAANMDHLWRASRGATDLVLECLTITGMQQTGTSMTLPTAPTLVLTKHNATYPLRSLITNPPLPSTQIQVLRVSWILGLSVEWQLELWIRPCRELRSLVWEAPSFPDPLLLQFVRCIEDGTWAWLTSLEISACVAPFPSDAAIARILSASSSSSSFYSSSSPYECSSYPPSPPRSTSSNSSSSSSSYSFDSRRSSNESTRRPHHHQNNVHLHRWERLIFRTVGFGPLAFEALRRHFGTLKTVKWIGYAGSVTNDMAREVLEECPLLEEFHAPFLWVDDFVGSQRRIDHAGEGQGQREKKDGGVDQGQGTLSYFSTATARPLPSPPLSPTPAPALIPDQQQQQQQQQLQLKPWPCEGLKSLFISATSPNFFAPPLSKPEEEIIRTRLATMKDLTYYCVGSTVFSTTFRHEY